MFQIPCTRRFVYFPIVFIFVGAIFALLSIFTKRGALPQFTALFLVLAAGSAQYAVITGEDQAKEVLQQKLAAKALIQHYKR